MSLLSFAAAPALAQDATWTGAVSSDWSNVLNWTPNEVPDLGGERAVFTAAPTTTAVQTSANVSPGGILFDATAPSYVITLGNSMTLTGGVENASGQAQTITVSSGLQLDLQGTAATGQGVIYDVNGALAYRDASVGGNSAINIMGQVGLFGDARTITMGSLSGGGGTLLRNLSGNDINLVIGTLDTSSTYGGSIVASSGALFVEKAGTGTLTLTGNNTMSGITVSAGTLRLGSDAAAGTGTITTTGSVISYADGVTIANPIVINGNTTQLEVLGTDRATQSGVISELAGPRPLEKIGDGTLILTGANTYTGTTTISAGTLQVGAGGTTGTLGTGNVVNNAALVFNRTDDISVSNLISGTGTLTQAGTGVLTLGAANTYSGGTTINAGTVALGDIGALGSGGVTLNGGTLRSNVTGTLANAITTGTSGTATIAAATGQNLTLGGVLTVNGPVTLALGSATETGTVTLSLSGASGMDSSSLLVAGGTLRTGNLAGAALLSSFGTTTIDAGATLDYDGTLGVDLTVSNLQGAGTLTNTAQTTVLAGSFAGAITGTGGLLKVTGGTLVLSGTNTYSGTTTINNGTLRIGDGGTTGTLGSGNVVVGNTLAFNRSDAALVVANAISGVGRIRQIGSGTTTLTGALSHTGGTFVDAGTLVLGDALNAVTLPSAATIASGATLTLANGSLGSGTITNGGDLGIEGTATAGSATITNDCCLRFSGSATAGTATITNNAAGNIDFDETSTAGSASITNAGSIRFLATASGGTAAYTGQTGSTVDFSWSSASAVTLGSLAGTGAVDLGSLTLTVGGNDTSTTFAGVIADGGVLGGTGGALTKVGTGTLTLTGANTYTGLTTISAGTLQIGAGGATGTLGSGNVVNNAALAFNRSDTVTLTNLVSGTGTLTQAGTGNLIVPGTQAYTGATFVNAGRISVNGSIASSSGVTVAAGGTLGGTGSLPGVSVLAGGTLAPGNSIGTIGIGGNLALAAGSTTQIEVQGPLIDRINVAGTAALGGTLRLLAQGGAYAFNAPYTLLQAAAVTGNFAAVNAEGSFGAGVTSTVTATATQAQLTLTPAPLVPIVTPTEPVVPPPVVVPPVEPPPVVRSAPAIGPRGTPNQVSVAAGLDRAVAGGADVAALFPLYNLPAAALPRGLDQVSGQIQAVASGMHAQPAYQFLGAILDPARGARALGDGAEGAAPRYAVWASGFGGGGRIGASGSPGTYAATASGGGVAVGADVRLTAHVVAGVALAGSGATTRLSDGMGRAETNQIQGAVYGTATYGALRLAAAVAYGGMDVTTRRTVPFLGLGDLRGRYTANGVSTRLEAGWRMEGIVPRVALTPSLAFQGSWYDTPSFTETGPAGPSAAALAVSGRNQGQSRMELSLRADMALTPTLSGFGRVGWAAYLQRDAGISARFAGLANSGFTLGGARPDAHAALLSGGVDWRLGAATTLTARVDAELASNSYAVNGTARIRYEF